MKRMSTIKEKIRSYWDYRAETFDLSPSHGIRSEEEKKAWMNILERNLNLDKNSKILDVGTGTGFLALLLVEMGYSVVGIDISENMLSKAIEKVRSNGYENTEFLIGDAETPPFDNERFDAIVSRHLLWTLPNPDKAIENWYKVLKPNGKILLIEGEWSPRSVSTKLKRIISYFLRLVIERRNLWKWRRFYNDLRDKLPFYGGASPNRVSSLFRKERFSKIWIDDLSNIVTIMKKHAPLYYRIMWPSLKYLVGGEKISKDVT